MELIDLQKAFDTINPDVPLHKLNATGFLEEEWLSSNLINYIDIPNYNYFRLTQVNFW